MHPATAATSTRRRRCARARAWPATRCWTSSPGSSRSPSSSSRTARPAPRYRLLESVAAYATERLHESADEAAARKRHLHHYLALAERAEHRLRGPRQQDWLARLDTEACNLRAALDEAVRRAAAGHSAEAVRLATALSWWWLLRGRLTEARRALAAVLAATAGAPDPELALLHRRVRAADPVSAR
ncbi:hypothetical protein LT493_40550 [Streptomyces tricolor]|nr:hypothetical protein [Streptomyces tricolor]